MALSFLDDLCERLGDSEQELTPQSVCRIISEHWGGERVYITKPKQLLEIDHRTTAGDLIKKGIPKSTAYRIVRRNWVRNW